MDSDETWWAGWVCNREEFFDVDEDPDPRIFKSHSSPLMDGNKNDIHHDISKSCALIWPKLSGQVGYPARKNCFDVGDDLNLDPDPRIF